MELADLRKLTKHQLLHILEGPIGIKEVERQLRASWKYHDGLRKDVNYPSPCLDCDSIKRDLGH